jgi:two-component system sensor kinase FixL
MVLRGAGGGEHAREAYFPYHGRGFFGHANAPDQRRLLIETSREGADMIRVSVADRGTGIPPEKLESIFEPFYSTKDTGLGMGLAICRTVIKAHGGRLWAANNRGVGATFHLTLALRARA